MWEIFFFWISFLQIVFTCLFVCFFLPLCLHFRFNSHHVCGDMPDGIPTVLLGTADSVRSSCWCWFCLFFLLFLRLISGDVTSGLLILMPANLCYWNSLSNGFSILLYFVALEFLFHSSSLKMGFHDNR